MEANVLGSKCTDLGLRLASYRCEEDVTSTWLKNFLGYVDIETKPWINKDKKQRNLGSFLTDFQKKNMMP